MKFTQIIFPTHDGKGIIHSSPLVVPWAWQVSDLGHSVKSWERHLQSADGSRSFQLVPNHLHVPQNSNFPKRFRLEISPLLFLVRVCRLWDCGQLLFTIGDSRRFSIFPSFLQMKARPLSIGSTGGATESKKNSSRRVRIRYDQRWH